jgi:hypothetical protein
MESIVIVILFAGSLAFIYFTERKREKAERERFREFVIANKAKDITEYVQAVPNDEPFEIKQEDELIDLDQLTPEELLEIKSKELK